MGEITRKSQFCTFEVLLIVLLNEIMDFRFNIFDLGALSVSVYR